MGLSFRELVLSVLEALKFRPEDLASRLGISLRAVQTWTSGDKDPYPKQFLKMAELCPQYARALKEAASRPRHRGRGRLIVPMEFRSDLSNLVERLSDERFAIDINDVLRQALARGIKSLSQQSPEEAREQLRLAKARRVADERVRAQLSHQVQEGVRRKAK